MSNFDELESEATMLDPRPNFDGERMDIKVEKYFIWVPNVSSSNTPVLACAIKVESEITSEAKTDCTASELESECSVSNWGFTQPASCTSGNEKISVSMRDNALKSTMSDSAASVKKENEVMPEITLDNPPQIAQGERMEIKVERIMDPEDSPSSAEGISSYTDNSHFMESITVIKKEEDFSVDAETDETLAQSYFMPLSENKGGLESDDTAFQAVTVCGLDNGSSEREVDRESCDSSELPCESPRKQCGMEYPSVAQTNEEKYSCTYCPKKFNKKNDIKRHLSTHTGEKSFLCTHCPAKFRQASHLNHHLATHTDEKPFLCKYCPAKFNRNGNLKTHMKIHTDERPHQCTHCPAKFRQMSHLKKHLFTHTGEKPFSCKYCLTSFNRSSSLKMHLTIHTDARPFSCKYCHAQFNRNGSLKRHLKSHTDKRRSRGLDEESIEPVECNVTPFTESEQCVESDNKSFQLLSVSATADDSSETGDCTGGYSKSATGKFPEKSSGDSFVSHTNLISKSLKLNNAASGSVFFPLRSSSADGKSVDESYVTKSKIFLDTKFQKSRKLDDCKPMKVSVVSEDLFPKSLRNSTKGSSEMHINSKSCLCIYCTGGTIDEKCDMKHRLSIHTGERPFPCAYCPAKFKRIYHLKEHLNIHMDKKPFSCVHCPAKFTHANSLKRHLYTHTGEKPYLCTFCPATFRSSGNLKKHLNVHTGKRPYVCTYCPAKFKQKPHLKKHLKIHTDTKPFLSTKCTTVDEETSETVIGSNLKPVSESIEYVECDDYVGGSRESFTCKLDKKSCDELSDLRTELVTELSKSNAHSESLNDDVSTSEVSPSRCNDPLSVDKEPVKNCIFIKSEDFLDTSFQKSKTLDDSIQINMMKVCEVSKDLSPVSLPGSVQGSSEMHINSESCQSGKFNYGTVAGNMTNHCSDKESAKSEETMIDTSQTQTQNSKCSSEFRSGHKKYNLITPTIDDKFLCAYCLKEFKKRSDIKRHLSIHTGDKPFSCTHCPAKFRQGGHLRTHPTTHTHEKLFLCPYCSKNFRRHGNLKRHLNIHTGARPYLCTYCPAKFKQSDHLKKHLKSHSNEKPFLGSRCPA